MNSKLIRIVLFFMLHSAIVNSQSNPTYTAITNVLSGTAQLSPATVITFTNIGKTLVQPSTLRESNASAKLLFKLDVGNDYIKKASNWTFTAQVEFTYQFTGASAISKTMTIDQASPELLKIDDVLATVNSTLVSAPLTVTITTVSIVTSPAIGLIQNFLVDNIRLTTKLEREYKVDVRLQNQLMPSAPLCSSVNIINRLVTFSWQPGLVDAYPNYEVQILKLYNTDEAYKNNQNEISTKVDWSKALKIETQSYQKYVNLTMAEGTGYYIWRVRPVGNYFDGGIANSENYGSWSTSYLDNATVTINKNAVNPSNNSFPYAFYFTDPDENINWIYSRVFTEGDNINKSNPTGLKSSEGINYANGLLISRQSQKYNSSEATTIVSQTEIDYSGRPALATMPVPVSGNLAGYKLGFVKNSSGALYTAAMFDADSKLNDPDKIDTTGAYKYYSYNSTYSLGVDNSNVPHAQGYSFKRTLFKTDGTNRVTEESGVGKTHALGTQANGRGRTTRILYGTPSEDELIRVFGDEAPIAKTVIKTMTIDQNNVISVSYTSKEGKVIATALISDTVENANPLGKAASILTVTNSISENVSNNGRIISSKRIAISKDSTLVKMSYNNDNLPGGGSGCPTGDCNLRMRFYLVDLTKNVTYVSDANNTSGITNFTPVPSFTFPAGWRLLNIDPVSPSTITPSGGSYNEIKLAAGEYIFVKEIFSGNSPSFADSIVQIENEKTKPIIDAIATKMQAVNSASAYATFTVFISNIITLLNTYNAGTPSATVALLDSLDINPGNLPVGFVFPLASDFTLSAIASNTTDPTFNDLEITTGCCGSLKVPIPKPPICYLCEGSPEAIYQVTASIATMTAANLSASEDAFTPYGFEDFKSNGSWAGMSALDKRNAINRLVYREMIRPLKLKMNEEGYDSTSTGNIGDLWKIAPGFNYESLNYLFSNMLISQYYTGSVIQHSSVPYAASYDTNAGGYSLSVPVSSLSPDYNYDCKKLYEAWLKAMEPLNSFELSDKTTNVLSEFNQQDGDNSGQSNSDDDSNWEIKNKLVKKYLKKKISKELEEFSDSDNGQVSVAKMQNATSVINNFIQEAGYQFAAIIDGAPLSTHISTAAGIYPDDYVAYGSAPSGTWTGIYLSVKTGTTSNAYVPGGFAVNGNTIEPSTTSCGGSPVRELYYPYITRPEWMFKYYVYNVFNDSYINDDSTIIANQVLLDISRKYNLPYSYITATVSASDMCNTPAPINYTYSANTFTMNYLHNNWDLSERLSFYNTIKGLPRCPEKKGIDIGENLFEDDQKPTCATKAELKAEALTACYNDSVYCYSKKASVIEALKEEFISSCYTIVACNPVAGQITEKQIAIMADTVIARAIYQVKYVKNKIDAIPTATNLTACADPSLTSSTNYSNLLCDLPSCWQRDCYEIVLYKNNTLGLASSRKLDVKLFSDCDRKILDMIEQGTFLPYIAPLDGCIKPDKLWRNNNCLPEVSCGDGTYKEKATCSPSEYKTYSKTFSVSASGGY